jgi:hypothetical protein
MRHRQGRKGVSSGWESLEKKARPMSQPRMLARLIGKKAAQCALAT